MPPSAPHRLLEVGVLPVSLGDDVLEGPTAGDHGQHVLNVRDHDVEEVRALGVEHFAHGGELIRVEDALGGDAVRVRHGHEVRVDVLDVLGQVPLGLLLPQVRVGAVLAIEAVLPLHDHAQVLVVEDDRLDVDLVHEHRGQLLHVHQEAPVAVDVQYRALGAALRPVVRHRRPQRRGEAEPHGTEAAGRDPLAGAAEAVVLRGPHLVLPHPRGHDRLAARLLAQHLHGLLRHDDVRAPRVGHRELGLLGHHGLAPLAVRLERHRLLGQEAVEGAHGQGHVGAQGNVRELVLVDLRRVDVHVHDACARGERLELARHAVVEPHAQRQEQVGLVDGVVGVDGAVHAQHRQAQLVVAGKRPQAHERVGDGDARAPHQLHNVVGAVLGPAAHVQHGAPCRADCVEDGLHRGRVGGRGQARQVARDGHVAVPVGHVQLLLHVLRDVHQHGAGAAGPCQHERLADDAGDVLHVHHEVVVLGDLPRDLHDRSLLETIRANHLTRHLARDRHHRHRVQQRVGQARDEVGGPRARRGDADGNLPRALRVPLGREDLALLVAAQHVPDGLRPRQGLVDLHGRPAGVRKHGRHPLALERLDDDVRALARLVAEAGLPPVHHAALLERLRALRLHELVPLRPLVGEAPGLPFGDRRTDGMAATSSGSLHAPARQRGPRRGSASATPRT